MTIFDVSKRLGATIMLLVFFSAVASAGIPLTINHQGVVRVNGLPFTGPGSFKFGFYDGGTQLWLWTNDGSRIGQAISNVPTTAVPRPVNNGIYNILLGDTSVTNMTSISSDTFDGDDILLRVYFDDGEIGEQVLLPDQPVGSAAYAFHAANADAVGGLDAASIASKSALDSLVASSINSVSSISHNRINIMINSIASSSQINSYSDGVVDIFTDASGYSDSINLGSTTVNYGGGKYVAVASSGAPTANPINSADSQNVGQTLGHGYRIRMNIDTSLLRILKEPSSTVSRVRILDSSKNEYVTWSPFVGDLAIITGFFVNGTTYYVVADANGAGYVRTNAPTPTYPITGPGLDYTGGLGDNTNDLSDAGYNIANIQTGGSTSGIVQTEILSIVPDPVAIQIVATNTVSGTASIDYDFKIGANAFQVSNALDAKIPNADVGNDITVRFNLTAVATGDIAVFEAY